MNTVPKEARRLLTLVLGQSAQYVIARLDRWIVRSGVEWTCSRLKAVRTAALQLRAGHPDKARAIYQENSISYHKGSCIPKGPLGKIVKNFVQARKPASIRRWDACLRVYTVLRLSTLSHAQEKKAYASISGTYQGDTGFLSKLSNVLEVFARKNLFRLVTKIGVPDVGRLKGYSNCHRTIGVPDDISEEAYASTTTSLLTSVWIPPSLRKLNPCEDLRSQLVTDGAEDVTAGHIAFIQEGGCKARVVAVPNAWCQWLFEPLHQVVDRLNRRLPNSAVHNQTAGGYFGIENLTRGCWCFDLSSATDRFPLELQVGVLRGLGFPTYAQAFEEISHGQWDFRGKTTMWGTGQPMGLYGSFPLFHLTHWCLLHEITRLSHWKALPGGASLPYFVLGDDVIITDKHVASMYQQTMNLLDVPVSPTKTVQSDRVAEFAGFVITKTNQQITAYRPYKYAKQGRKVYPLNLMYSMGSKVKGLSHWWERTYPLFAKTISSRDLDLSPLLSEDDKEGRSPASIDSHLLGSLANRIAYDLPYAPSAEFASLWRYDRYLLLGQKERLNSSGFAPKNLNPEGIGKVERDDPDRNYANSHVWSDPLMREAKRASEVSEVDSSSHYTHLFT